MTGTNVETELREWFEHRLPAEWASFLDVRADDDEILVVITLPDAQAGKRPKSASAKAKPVDIADDSAQDRIARFREETREKRMEIAAEAEHLFNRKVSWGASSGGVTKLFTHLSIPVMTRLRLPERAVLDTLVAAGVARSRSHALAWCARLVSEHQAEWLEKLREAFAEVEKVRRQGPATTGTV